MQSSIRYLRRHHVGLLALFIALGGTSYAAVKLPANSVGTKQLKANAITGAKVKNGSLAIADFGGRLPAGAIGATGATGVPGATGPAGAQGLQGEKGENGTAGASFVPTVTRPSATNGPNSDDTKTVTVECPAGKLAIGGYNVTLPTDAPIATPSNHETIVGGHSAWTVTSREAVATAQNWSLTVNVACVG